MILGFSPVLRAEVPAEKLSQLKAATVFIKVSMDSGESSGTGFLVNRNGQFGYVATAAHLLHMPPVAVRRIECVFNSGDIGEMTVVASVVSMDLNRDLAILKLELPKLPDPIDVSTSVLPTETSPVFILGFPFGSALSTSHRNPAMTISSAHVSSIRRDDNNDLAFVQLDGGIDPGNSGGPVVTEEGVLVGIAVAKVVGSGIGIAIPASHLANALTGGTRSVTFAQRSVSAGSADFDVRVEVSDPLGRIRAVQIVFAPANSPSSSVERDVDGNWPMLKGNDQSEPMPVKERFATGKVSVTVQESELTRLVYQLVTIDHDGTLRGTALAELIIQPTFQQNSVADNGLSSEQAPAGEIAKSEYSSMVSDAPIIFGQNADSRIPEYRGGEKTIELNGSVSEVALGGGGRYVVIQTEPEGEIIVFDVSQGSIIYRFSVDAGTLIAASAEFLITVTPFDKSVEFRPFDNLAQPRRKELPIDCAIMDIAVGFASHGPLCISWAEGAGESDRAYMSFLELPTLEPVIPRGVFQSSYGGNPNRLPIGRWGEFQGMHVHSFGDQPRLRASASGNVFGCWSLGHSPSGLGISTFDDGSILTYYEHTSVGHIAPSADGQYVCTADGIYSVDLTRKKGADFTVPSTHAQFLLSFPTNLDQSTRLVDVTKGKVIDSQSGHVALQLPPLLEVLGVPPDGQSPGMLQVTMEFASGITPDQRLLLIPQAQALVTLNADNRSLRIRPIELRGANPSDSMAPEQAQPQLGISNADLTSTFGAETLADRTTQIRMPAVIGDALVAADGKYLLIHLAEKGQIVVMDAFLGSVVKVLMVPADALIAASANELVVLSPFSKKISRWDLDKFERVLEASIMTSGQVDAIAMGAGSKGPLLLHWRDSRSHKAGFAFYDPRTLQPMANQTLTVVSDQASMLVGEIGRNGDFELPQYHGSAVPPSLRASGNGNVFGLSNGSSVVTFALSEKSVTANLTSKSVLYAAPNSDGSNLCTSDGYYTADMTRVRLQEPSIPSTMASLYLSLQKPTDNSTHQSRSFPVKGFVNSQETGRSILALPALKEMEGQYLLSQLDRNIALDRRYNLLGEATLLVTIPPSNDRIILRRLEIPADKVVSKNQPLSPQRTWTDDTGKYRFNAALINSTADHVELQAADGRVIKVPISRLSKSDLDYLATLKGADDAGNRVGTEVESVERRKGAMGARTPSVYSYVKIQGRAGDYVTDGQDFFFDGVKSGLQLMPTQRGVRIAVEGWELHFEAKEGEFLKVGKYQNAERASSGQEFPGISISGQGRGCNQTFGEFEVLEIDLMGGKIHRLAIDFSQSCEERKPKLNGVLRFNSTVR